MQFDAPSGKFRLPDIIGYLPFKLSLNPHLDAVSAESNAWMEDCGFLRKSELGRRHTLAGCNYLTALVFPEADRDRLRLCCDYVNAIFAWDDVFDDGDLTENPEGAHFAMEDIMSSLRDPENYKPDLVPSRMLHDMWFRAKKYASPGCQQRFVETMYGYTYSEYQQVMNRVNCEDLDIESYITWRRESSCARPVWALVEMSHGMNLPDEVFEHPSILRLDECATDMVGLSNDLYSFNREQARGQYANLVPIAMNELDLTLQEAIDYVDGLLRKSLDDFLHHKSLLPSWGPEVDQQVQAYVRGMEHWIVGSIKWGFDSKRYFGAEYEEFKRTFYVTLWPQEVTSRNITSL